MAFLSRSLRLKVSLGVCLALIALLAPLNWLQYQLQRRAAIADLELLAATTGAVAVQSLEEAMLTNNRFAIQAIVASVPEPPAYSRSTCSPPMQSWQLHPMDTLLVGN